MTSVRQEEVVWKMAVTRLAARAAELLSGSNAASEVTITRSQWGRRVDV